MATPPKGPKEFSPQRFPNVDGPDGLGDADWAKLEGLGALSPNDATNTKDSVQNARSAASASQPPRDGTDTEPALRDYRQIRPQRLPASEATSDFGEATWNRLSDAGIFNQQGKAPHPDSTASSSASPPSPRPQSDSHNEVSKEKANPGSVFDRLLLSSQKVHFPSRPKPSSGHHVSHSASAILRGTEEKPRRLAREQSTIPPSAKTRPLDDKQGGGPAAKAVRTEAGIPASPSNKPQAFRGGQPGGARPRAAAERIKRTIRLTATVHAKLQQAAAARGLDLNSAIAVAISEDWRRCYPGRDTVEDS